MNRRCAVLLLIVSTLSAQDAPRPAAQTPAPAKQAAGSSDGAAQTKPNRGRAYYHYSLAHYYEELFGLYGRSEHANKAIEEYRLAMEHDPHSEQLNSGLAELYAKTGRIRDAVLEAQEILKRDPNNLEARKLLGRIYLRSLGDMNAGTQSHEVLRLAIEQFEHIARIEPKNPDHHVLLGRLYITNRDLAKAETAFKTAAALQPESEEVVVHLAYLYNELGQPRRAVETLERIPVNRRGPKVYSALGYAYEQQKDHKKAVEVYRKAVELDSDNLEAIRGLAQNLLNDGQQEAALQQYRAIIQADPQDAQAHLRMSEIYRRTGKYQLALDSLKKAESLVQDSLEVPYNYALIYEAQGRYDEAAAALNQLLTRTARPSGNYSSGERNNRAVFLERLGVVQRSAGKHALAIESFRKILELGGENASRGYQQLIDTYREQKQWDQALAVAREAVEKLPNDRQMKLVLAGQLADMGNGDHALKEARALLTHTDEDRDVWVALAQINSRLRRWKDAEEAITKAEKLATGPEDRDYMAFILGSMYERQKKYNDAEQIFRKVVASDPSNAMALNYLGYMLADRGVRLEEAIGYIKRALQLDPQNGAYLDSLGWAYFKQGKFDLAEENLRKAVERIPNDSTIHDHLGDLYMKLGRLKQAASHWQRALVEWNKSVPADVDPQDVARVQRKLESAKVRLAKGNTE